MFRRESWQASWHHYQKPIHVVGWFALFGIVVTTGTALIMADDPTQVEADLVVPAIIRTANAPTAAAVETDVTIMAPTNVVPPPAPPAHATMPKEVRGFYMTSNTAGSAKLRHNLFEYAKRNDLNTVVIDIKDSDGNLAFGTQDPALQEAVHARPTISNLDAVLTEAKSYGLYTIARQFVFQDPAYAQRHPDQAVLGADGKVWQDYKGISWVDPAAQKAWSYNMEVSVEAYRRGFDEIQFDYIRFPSDGKLSTIHYAVWDGKKPKEEVIGDFFRYMHQELEVRRQITISFDLFGFATWYRDFDMGIGQLLTNALPNSTAVSAMVYPSHYPPGTLKYANPADHPYEIVQYSLAKANSLTDDYQAACANGIAKFVVSASGTQPVIAMPCGVTLARERPWLQAFDIGAVYTKDLINAQIKAARDENAGGWLLWNARNVYRDLK
jgi:hypothetical protein